jgi:hypothetical protein
MTGTTRDLVDAIASGDAVNIETSFNAAMAEKISVKLDAMRQEVAQNMFKTPAETSQAEE